MIYLISKLVNIVFTSYQKACLTTWRNNDTLKFLLDIFFSPRNIRLANKVKASINVLHVQKNYYRYFFHLSIKEMENDTPIKESYYLL